MDKIGIAITVFNRPEYLRRTLESIDATDFTAGCTLYMYNDGSTDKEAVSVFNEWYPHVDCRSIRRYCWESSMSVKTKRARTIKFTSRSNKGMFSGLEYCWDKAIKDGCTILSNLDSDVEVRPHWLSEEIKLLEMFPEDIITGFNTTSGGRHPIIEEYKEYRIKKSIGGINKMFTDKTYLKVVKPSLKSGFRWDWSVCEKAAASGVKLICTKPSVVQHIGVSSTVGHEDADIALDF
jgi:glycosyltransferase involved in cell wall biosynthesis